jgi:large subunit ribosomal protein L5
MHSSLDYYYSNIICEDFILKEKICNIHRIPLIKSISLSHSSRLIAKNDQLIVPVISGFELICGQRSKVTRAKHSISGFQIRKDQVIGSIVTLRKKNLFSFLEKLLFIVLPRLNTEKGQRILKNTNLSFGVEQLLLFPEIESDYEFFEFVKGCDIHILTSSKTLMSSRLILTGFKVPNTR